MFQYNSKHPEYVHATLGCKCLKCMTDVFYYNDLVAPYQTVYTNKTARTCRCKQVGLTIDEDDTLTFYVDDINTIHMGYYVFNADSELLNVEWIGYSNGHIYVDYTDVANSKLKLESKESFYSNQRKPKTPKPRANYYGFDLELLDSLDVHKDYMPPKVRVR